MGLGPLAVGAMSDALHPAFGAESLRYALIAMSPVPILGGWELWRASRSVCRDLRAAGEADTDPDRCDMELEMGAERL
jgi:hypothetical protein